MRLYCTDIIGEGSALREVQRLALKVRDFAARFFRYHEACVMLSYYRIMKLTVETDICEAKR
jgi:hypothetical protein